MAIQVSKRLFTVDEYYRMGETGILSKDDRVELIEGEIIEMSPIGSAHAWCINRLVDLLTVPQLKGFSFISVQNPIHLDNYSEPQPDVVLLKRRDDYPARQHPTPADILLVIEVADTSVDYDCKVKLPLYAKARISEAWLIDLPANMIDVCSEPANGQYQTIQRVQRGDTLMSPTIPNLILKVETILG